MVIDGSLVGAFKLIALSKPLFICRSDWLFFMETFALARDLGFLEL